VRPDDWSEGAGWEPGDAGLGPMVPGPQRSPRRHLVAGDVVALVVAWTPPLFGATGASWPARGLCAAAAAAVTLVVLRQVGLYRSHVCAHGVSAANRAFVAAATGAAVFAMVAWVVGAAALDPALEGAAAAVLMLLVVRFRFDHWLRAHRSAGAFQRTVVLVGTNDDTESLWAVLNHEPELGYRIGAVAGERVGDAPWAHLPSCTTTGDLAALAAQVGASGVIVVVSALRPHTREVVVAAALDAGLHVQLWAGLPGVASRRVRPAPVSGIPVFYVEPQRVRRWQLLAKRTIDVTFAVVILLLTSPLLLVVAVLIKREDGGPVLYRSRRVGRAGDPIDVLKLRTMVPNASELLTEVAFLNERIGGPLFKASDDPRVTRIGRVIRGMSMDELPQLWNVLAGTMSLVGPRPALPSEVEHFDAELRRRHAMRPGITGLWQIEARDNPSFNAYRRLDLAYVDNWSLKLDIAILASTVHEVVAGSFRTVLKPFRRSRRPRPAPDLSAERVSQAGSG